MEMENCVSKENNCHRASFITVDTSGNLLQGVHVNLLSDPTIGAISSDPQAEVNLWNLNPKDYLIFTYQGREVRRILVENITRKVVLDINEQLDEVVISFRKNNYALPLTVATFAVATLLSNNNKPQKAKL